MLVLSRKTGESIYIGRNRSIIVKVLTNDGQNVRIGLEAPKGVLINRQELSGNMQYDVEQGKHFRKLTKLKKQIKANN